MREKKRFLAGFLAVVLAGTLCACRADPEPVLSTTQPQPATTTAPAVHVLRGVVTRYDETALCVQEDTGICYTFALAALPAADEAAAPLAAGARVEITYNGTLDPSVAAQPQAAVLTLLVLEAADPAAAAAEASLAAMSLEEKVGQMFFARCPLENQAAIAAQYHLGGYLYFAKNLKDQTPETLLAQVNAIQAEAAVPLLIGVDEEGGTVNRLSSFSAFRAEPFRSPKSLYDTGGLELVRSDTREKAALLQSVGFNVNFAPACDVSTQPGDFIYSRALGYDAQTTAAYVSAVVEENQAAGIGSVLKHFPGYGGNGDTHQTTARDERPMEAFRTTDFLPFTAGIQAGAPCVLISHTVVAAMDAAMPASLSQAVHTVLREELGFDGVIITDDLSMGAIGEHASEEEAAVLAVLAGNDMLISSDFSAQIAAVLAAVQQGRIPETRVNDSVRRILEWKFRLGLLRQPEQETAEPF